MSLVLSFFSDDTLSMQAVKDPVDVYQSSSEESTSTLMENDASKKAEADYGKDGIYLIGEAEKSKASAAVKHIETAELSAEEQKSEMLAISLISYWYKIILYMYLGLSHLRLNCKFWNHTIGQKLN